MRKRRLELVLELLCPVGGATTKSVQCYKEMLGAGCKQVTQSGLGSGAVALTGVRGDLSIASPTHNPLRHYATLRLAS